MKHKTHWLIALACLFVFSSSASAYTQCFSPQDIQPSYGDPDQCDVVNQFPGVPPTPSTTSPYSQSVIRCGYNEHFDIRWEVPWWADPSNGDCAAPEDCRMRFSQVKSYMVVVPDTGSTTEQDFKWQARAIGNEQAEDDIDWDGSPSRWLDYTLSTSLTGLYKTAIYPITDDGTSGLVIYDASSGSGTTCNSDTNDCTSDELIIRTTRKTASPTQLSILRICFSSVQ